MGTNILARPFVTGRE